MSTFPILVHSRLTLTSLPQDINICTMNRPSQSPTLELILQLTASSGYPMVWINLSTLRRAARRSRPPFEVTQQPTNLVKKGVLETRLKADGTRQYRLTKPLPQAQADYEAWRRKAIKPGKVWSKGRYGPDYIRSHNPHVRVRRTRYQ